MECNYESSLQQREAGQQFMLQLSELKMYLNYILSTKNFSLSKLQAEISKTSEKQRNFQKRFYPTTQ